ncbi:hypothetical protein [Streptomyces sp. NPDC060022]|uniref:hypothetical protein n=1 Tax=Streptomyces sp. NPDC060022 TaxID=3347039 RepID=UPI003677D555
MNMVTVDATTVRSTGTVADARDAAQALLEGLPQPIMALMPACTAQRRAPRASAGWWVNDLATAVTCRASGGKTVSARPAR